MSRRSRLADPITTAAGLAMLAYGVALLSLSHRTPSAPYDAVAVRAARSAPIAAPPPPPEPIPVKSWAANDPIAPEPDAIGL